MYKDYFGLIDQPFSIAPNPQYLYMSNRHREALAHLLYGITMDGGFILLTGEVGTGKTTVCRCLLEQIPDKTDTAFILSPKLTSHELLATICDELHISYEKSDSIKALIDALNKHLLQSHAQSRKTVLIIDEAQNLSIDVLEQLRLLTNLETNQSKLMQVILLGQPELNTMLAKDELRQLSQRVTARFHLEALNRSEVSNYISHRLMVAGARGVLFEPKAVLKISKKSGGIPRLINLLCDRALLGTYAQNRLTVDVKTVNQSAREISAPPTKPGRALRRVSAVAFVITLIVIGGLIATPGNFSQLLALSTKLTFLQPASEAPATDPVPEPKTTHPSDLKVAEEQPTVQQQLDTGQGEEFNNTSEASTEHPGQTKSRLQPEIFSSNLSSASTIIDPIRDSLGDSPGHSTTVQNDDQTAVSEPPNGSEAEITLTESLDSLLKNPAAISQDSAFRELLNVWNIEFAHESNNPLCEQSLEHNMRCLSGIGSLRELSHNNRPAILTFLHSDGFKKYATLTAIDNNTVTLQIDSQQHKVNVSDLITHWTGEYTLIWRTPPGHRISITTGDYGDDIFWLNAALAKISGTEPRTSENLIYDAVLQEQVRMFQLSAGLIPDGIVGTQTWIQISSNINHQVPLLLGASK